jgi:hypothetical protein
MLFAAGLAFAACTLVQCQSRQYNQSEIKGAEDILSMEKDPSGSYTVTCKNGSKEYKVAMSEIQSNRVCKATSPRDASSVTSEASSITAEFGGTFTVMCKNGAVEHGVSKARVDSGDYCGRKLPPSQGDNQVNPKVNPMAFNASNLWRDGKGTPILQYPSDFRLISGRIAPDGLFYLPPEEYWQEKTDYFAENTFTGSVTEGVKMEGNIVTYPAKEGRTLALKFSDPAGGLTHRDAALHCQVHGQRLPHIQEILDFCAAGTPKNRYGKYEDSRCKSKSLWTASVDAENRYYAWAFQEAYASSILRQSKVSVRCVGAP